MENLEEMVVQSLSNALSIHCKVRSRCDSIEQAKARKDYTTLEASAMNQVKKNLTLKQRPATIIILKACGGLDKNTH